MDESRHRQAVRQVNARRYRAVLFDFDGVIIDSMPIRSYGFERIFADFPEEPVASLVAYHNANGGLSRFVKIRYFFERLLKRDVSDAEVQAYARRYSEIMKARLTDPGVIIGETREFIENVSGAYRLHVVSGSEGNELRFLCEALGLSRFFESIEGSPTPKNRLVADLLARCGYAPETVCLIGDSVNDLEAAAVNGVDFYGYNNERLRGCGQGYIDTFDGFDFKIRENARY